ncbi:PREDICTED: protein enabled homolog [Chinchilla lanigera]|uniref:protein enabled homolog n=1 Tax=Chinchilla lanigera TaxID=34839 RepID=UPI00038EFD89|nr:PREDICTED: protein enabled homolog [Chinchilla lanigera]
MESMSCVGGGCTKSLGQDLPYSGSPISGPPDSSVCWGPQHWPWRRKGTPGCQVWKKGEVLCVCSLIPLEPHQLPWVCRLSACPRVLVTSTGTAAPPAPARNLPPLPLPAKLSYCFRAKPSLQLQLPCSPKKGSEPGASTQGASPADGVPGVWMLSSPHHLSVLRKRSLRLRPPRRPGQPHRPAGPAWVGAQPPLP